ncbi:hypothetical protein [Nannocystis sp.]|uniref:hypothetical protein n=1 Tax=Nannocystis sp. TaxID=1962667 RepID=UPI00344B86C7
MVQQNNNRPVIQRFPNPAAPPGPYVPGRPPHNHPPQNNWGTVQQHAKAACWREPTFDRTSPYSIPGPGRGAVECVCAVSKPLEVLNYAFKYEMRDKPLAREHLQHYVSGRGIPIFEHKNLDDLLTRNAHVRGLIAAAMEFQGDEGNLFFQQYSYQDDDFQYAFGGIDRVDFKVNRTTGTIDVWFIDPYDFHPADFNHANLGVGDDPPPGRPTNCVHAAAVEAKSFGAADYWMIGHATLPLELFTEHQDQVKSGNASNETAR